MTWSLSLALAASLALQVAASAQGAGGARKTSWDGVYTAAQAMRGRDEYATHCSRCHGAGLRGGTARTLTGETFVRDWTDETVDHLFTRIKSTMPRGTPGVLTDDVYLAIVAYILEGNGYPSGAADMTPAVMADTMILSKEGPGFVPNFSMVRVVGCLARGDDKSWHVRRATDPARIRNPQPSETERQQSAGLPLGDKSFRLMYVYPEPVSLEGHKVEARGILMKVQGDDRINVVALGSVGSSCGE